MQDTFVMFARYSKKANSTIYELLDAMSAAERDQDRKSFCVSLGGLAAHLVDGTTYFLGLIGASVPRHSAALDAVKGVEIPQAPLGDDGWKKLKGICASVDDAVIAFYQSLREEDCTLPIKLDWYDGNPAEVPLHFLANQLVVHSIHHRGQISQILDSLGVEHDFSGIDLEFLSR